MKKSIQTPALLVALVGALLLLAPAPSVHAADSLAVCFSGQPYLWPAGGANIPFHPDQGDLGPVAAAAAVALTQQSFDNWTNTGATSATYANGGLLPVDVDITNFGPYLSPAAPDGLSAIVFDDTGEIFDLLFGVGSGILGFAGPEWANTVTCDILEGVSFLNGPAFTNLSAAEDVMTHEFGHYSNLGHVELNGQLFPFGEGGDTSGPSPDNPFVFPGFAGTEVIESMYPFYFGDGSGTKSPHADDVASIATLYPAPGFFGSTGSIVGTIFAPNGSTRLSGVNVIARNVANPFLDAVSTFSGAHTDSTSQADPNVGTFALHNLTPGAQYVLFVDEVTALAGRFSNPILGSLPGPEEYWNGAAESSNASTDDPLSAVNITPIAGSASVADIVFNTAGPGVITLGDDDFEEIFLPFPFEICGQSFDSVFVNSNGSLTFGSGDTDFTESAAELLRDQPRIAALWDDLSPNNGGTVSFSTSKSSFSVRFDGVPEFLNTGANTFEITLKRSSNHVDIAYGSISAADGLAGVSCGGVVTSGFETEEDLSALGSSRINLHNQPARYELFAPGENDIANSTVRFNGTTDYNDTWAGKNDTPRKARRLSLPFDSIDVGRFTEIEPTGGDIDWFRFSGAADTTLVAEILTGQLDTLIALFDAKTGALVAVDDDGGTGLLSRIQAPLPSNGDYLLAVTTFPDLGLIGAGSSGGRYVLDLFAVDGILLDLGDDNFAEVSLDFSFPFQGSSYNSVFVNSNGNLTFGSGDTDFSESVAELLSDQPRIAALWDDLSPNSGGQVIVERDATSATVTFDSVPEFPATGSNTFAITLFSDGTVTIDYGAVSASDGIVGVSEGGGATNPGETDLSAGGPFPVIGTTYEQFGFGDPFDLGGSGISFDP